jgi:hypothetical protein
MTDEKCVNCGKTKEEHIIVLDKYNNPIYYCYIGLKVIFQPRTPQKTNCENFDDGLTQVAPKGEFKAMKTPQQIKSEVEKAIIEYSKRSQIGIHQLRHYITDGRFMGILEIYTSQILTEYDKSIKDIINKIKPYDEEGSVYPDLINREELLTKIGDNSEVEK